MNKPVLVRLPEEQIENLKRHANIRSGLYDKEINYIDLIRESIDQCFPFIPPNDLKGYKAECSGVIYKV